MDTKIKELPKKYEGYVLKRRKWPLKGWHKRYFVLDKGILKYSKSPQDIAKDKLHGMLDVGMSVMSTKKKSRRINLDAEDTIFHIKVKSQELFKTWVVQFKAHAEYRQNEIKNDTTLRADSSESYLLSPTLPTIVDTKFSSDHVTGMQDYMKDLVDVKKDVEIMKKLITEMTLSPATTPTGFKQPPNIPLSKKERKMSKKNTKKSNKTNTTITTSSVALAELTTTIATEGCKVPVSLPHPGQLSVSAQSNLSKSNPDLLANNGSRPSLTSNSSSHSVQSTPTHNNKTMPSFSIQAMGDDSNNNLHTMPFNNHNLFLEYAVRVCTSLESTIFSLEKRNETAQEKPHQSEKLYKLLNQLNSENKDLKSRLHRINLESSISSISPAATLNIKHQAPAESQLSISEALSECFYDAEEYLISDDESSTDGEESDVDAQSTDSQMSDGLESGNSMRSMPFEVEVVDQTTTGRRKKLPVFKPEGGDFSLWNILKKNIGKDLSKVSMPVTMNEPLNALQLLCEGMEYSEILDKVVLCDDPYERMVLVAAFAVSAYGSTYTRAGQKPFNPLLGETYECIREDKGFKFIAEQVSHHPPISACHCVSDCYEFYQDARWKNKFWGKSMEILPMGLLHLNILKFNEQYEWNKVTTCVHNIMSGTRWVEHYGEMKITSKEVTCKIVFNKSGYWNTKNGEFTGNVLDKNGDVKRHIHGKWFEGFYCGYGNKSRCIWRPAPMPPDHERYYGFSQFAIELNELDDLESDILPRTDTRFRPDQRALENGNIDLAEELKQQLEQKQRERRKEREEKNEEYQPIFFKKVRHSNGEEIWMSKQNYWNMRNSHNGFQSASLPNLWG